MDISMDEKFAKLKSLLTGLAPHQDREDWMFAKEADEKITKREGDLFAAWRDLGSCLTSIRLRHKSDKDFSAACFEHGINRTTEHIGAAIWLASLDDDQLSTLREEFPTALHPATLRNKCRELYPEWLVGTREAGLHSVQTAPQSEKSPEVPVFTAKTPETQNETVEKSKQRSDPPTKASISGKERADEVWPIISTWGTSTRRGVNELHAKEGWPLLLECLDLGLFSENGVGTSVPTARAIFNLPLPQNGSAMTELGKYDLSKPAGCKKAREELMPFFYKHAEDLKANPASFSQLLMAYTKAKSNEAIKAEQEKKLADAMAAIAARGEKEVIVCGKRLWPREDTNYKSYNYEQLRLAWFMFLDAEGVAQASLVSKEGRRSRAICHRHLAKHYNESFAIFKDKPGCEELVEHAQFVSTAYIALAEALQNGEDDKLQTSIPWHDIKISNQ